MSNTSRMSTESTVTLADIVPTISQNPTHWMDYIGELENKIHYLELENQELKYHIDSIKANKYQFVSPRDALEIYLMPDFNGKIYYVWLGQHLIVDEFERMTMEDLKDIFSGEYEDEIFIIEYPGE